VEHGKGVLLLGTCASTRIAGKINKLGEPEKEGRNPQVNGGGNSAFAKRRRKKKHYHPPAKV